MLKWIQSRFSARARKRRGEFLTRMLNIPIEAKILDLGGGSGSHIRSILPQHQNVTVCDISAGDLEKARSQFGFCTVLLRETDNLPFEDAEFDFCFCSSVIEHVTGPKDQVVRIREDDRFREIARQHQKRFAREISRVARSYYVQTPYRYFPIESHTWLPGYIVLLPRRAQIGAINVFNRFWFKKTAPDWHLFDRREMAETFPDATIYSERYFLMTKSLMAIRTR